MQLSRTALVLCILTWVSLVEAQRAALFTEDKLPSSVAWPEGSGKDLQEGTDRFHVINSGPCAINEARLHKYATSLSASANVMAVGGDHGKAIAECISDNCDAVPRIDFEWVPPATEGQVTVVSALDALDDIDPAVRAGGELRSWPRCERGDWKPSTPSTVFVSVFNNKVAFAGGGCVELQGMDLELQQWSYISSLPKALSLVVPKGRKPPTGDLRPEMFGTSIALGDGALVVTGATGAEGEPPVVVVFSLLGADWDQVDVLECNGPGCACTGSARSSCFGAALAINGKRVAVGNPQNGTVLVYEQARGVPLAWNLVRVLISPFHGATSSTGPSMFGASLSLAPSLLVVGAPSNGPGARGVVYNMAQGVGFGSLVYDTSDHCCKLGLPCCISGLVGSATTAVEYEDEAAVIIGDPRSAQVHVVKCNTTALKEGSAAGDVCSPSVTVQGSSTPGQSPADVGPDGFGGSLAYGGQMILMGHPARHCSAVGPMQACGTVCEVPLCAPGYCLLYEISLDQEFCQECSDKSRCKGGMRTCSAGDSGALGAMALSTVLFFLLFCCLYSLSAFSRGSGPISLLVELFCCVPIGGTGRERLLSDDGGEGGGAREDESSDSDVEHEGYIPPAVKAALAGVSVGPTNDEVSHQGGKEEDDEAGEGLHVADAGDGGEAVQRGEEGGSASGGGDVRVEVEDGEGGIAEGAGDAVGEGVAKVSGKVEESLGPAKTSAPRRLAAHYDDDPDEESVGVSLNYFQCKICFERPIQTVLVPCGHQALCRKCARKMKTCPICRKVVGKVQQVFHI